MTPTELEELSGQVRAGEVRLWHGGAPDLKPGDLLLPPSATGATSIREHIASQGYRRVTASDDFVYVTTERDIARTFAAFWSRRTPSSDRGWLYRVELTDFDLQLDDDLPRGPYVSFQLPAARVGAVIDRGVDPHDPKHRRRLEQFIRLFG